MSIIRIQVLFFFNYNDENDGDWYLKDVLGLRFFVVIKLPEGDTVVRKHVEAGT